MVCLPDAIQENVVTRTTYAPATPPEARAERGAPLLVCLMAKKILNLRVVKIYQGATLYLLFGT